LESFLEQFSTAHSEEINILQLDNERSHLAKDLLIPENVYLIFQSPYSVSQPDEVQIPG